MTRSGAETKRALHFFQNLIGWSLLAAQVNLHLKETHRQDHRRDPREGHQRQGHLDHLLQ